jgi:hypothetical protein
MIEMTVNFNPEEAACAPTTGVRRAPGAPVVAAADESLQGFGCPNHHRDRQDH